MRNICPACGFPSLDEAPWSLDGGGSEEICPSCGIQFGYDDFCGGDAEQRKRFYEDWRLRWVAEGMPWSSLGVSSPNGWNPAEQLKNVEQNEG